VKDQSDKPVKKLCQSLHHISAQNSILRREIRGLGDSLLVKKRRQKKSFTLQLSKPQEYHGGAVFWSSKKCHQAQDDKAIQQQEAQQVQLQKAERSELQRQARLYKLQVAQEKRVEQERLKEVRAKEKAEEAAEKERQKAARNAQKAIQLFQKGKRKASQAQKPPTKRQTPSGAGAARTEAPSAVIAAPLQKTKMQSIRKPKKYSE
jgi:hypothetical protein